MRCSLKTLVRGQQLATYLLLIIISLAPRLWQIGHYLTPDEFLSMRFARDFVGGLANGDESLTLGWGYPGIVPVWFHGAGLLILYGLTRLGWIDPFPPELSLETFLGALDALPLPYIIAGQVGNVILVVILLCLVYTVGLHLFGREAAFVTALLLTLDPTLLGYSRLAHMVIPHALLMLLSIMTWLLWWQQRRWIWLLLCGVFTGLALVTLSVSFLLLPSMMGISWLLWGQGRIGLRNEAKDELKPGSALPIPQKGENQIPLSRRLGGASYLNFLITLLIAFTALIFTASLSVFIVWPALWTDPIAAVTVTLDRLLSSSQAGFGDLGTFWLGEFVAGPGPSYYPIVWLLKVSPLVMVGLIAGLVAWRSLLKEDVFICLWAYALFYMAVMSIGSAKNVRLILPALTAMAPLAAYGLLHLRSKLANLRLLQILSLSSSRQAHELILHGLFFFCLALTLVYSPYYLSYYNPLVLGWRWAPQTMQVGWGEGLSDAARYLNQMPDIEQKTIAAWYDWLYSPYAKGQVLPLSGWNAVTADYTVFYVNQVQRNIPDPNLITYFQRRRPEHVIRKNGIDYAWIYPSVSQVQALSGQVRPLPEQARPLFLQMGEEVVLEGVEIASQAELVDKAETAFAGVNVTLYWRALKPNLPEYFVYLRALDEANEIQARSDSPPVMNFWPTTAWVVGELVSDVQRLPRPRETERAIYRLEVGLYHPDTWVVLEPQSGEHGPGGGVIIGEIAFD